LLSWFVWACRNSLVLVGVWGIKRRAFPLLRSNFQPVPTINTTNVRWEFRHLQTRLYIHTEISLSYTAIHLLRSHLTFSLCSVIFRLLLYTFQTFISSSIFPSNLLDKMDPRQDREAYSRPREGQSWVRISLIVCIGQANIWQTEFFAEITPAPQSAQPTSSTAQESWTPRPALLSPITRPAPGTVPPGSPLNVIPALPLSFNRLTIPA
jgi:hypothetical protein